MEIIGKTHERLKKCFLLATGIPEKDITDETAYGTDKWDSISHMALVSAIEDEFEILLETEDILAMSTFGKVHGILATRYNVK